MKTDNVVFEDGKCIISREQYKTAKKMNRDEMERFLGNLMMIGVQEGIDSAGGANSINVSGLMADIKEILRDKLKIGDKRFSTVETDIIAAVDKNSVIIDSEDITYRVHRAK